MGITLIGKLITTNTGTKVTRYLENGHMHKSVDFTQSSNKVAKQKGLAKILVTYGLDSKPEKITDTFVNGSEVKSLEKI